MVGWIVWYDDGSSFSSLEGSPQDAPRIGVICICERSQEHGRIIWVGHDYYWWHDDGVWVGGDASGLNDYLDQPGAYKVRLKGRSVPATRHHRIYKLACEDTRLPPKTSNDWLEGVVT